MSSISRHVSSCFSVLLGILPTLDSEKAYNVPVRSLLMRSSFTLSRYFLPLIVNVYAPPFLSNVTLSSRCGRCDGAVSPCSVRPAGRGLAEARDWRRLPEHADDLRVREPALLSQKLRHAAARQLRLQRRRHKVREHVDRVCF